MSSKGFRDDEGAGFGSSDCADLGVDTWNSRTITFWNAVKNG